MQICIYMKENMLYHYTNICHLIKNIQKKQFLLRPLHYWAKKYEWGEDWSYWFTATFKESDLECIVQAPNFRDEVYFVSWTNASDSSKMWASFSHNESPHYQGDSGKEDEEPVGAYSGVLIAVEKQKVHQLIEEKVKELYENVEENGIEAYRGIFDIKAVRYLKPEELKEELGKVLNSPDLTDWTDPKVLLQTDVMSLLSKYDYQEEVRSYIYYDKQKFEEGIPLEIADYNDFISSITFDPRLDPKLKEIYTECLVRFGIAREKFIESTHSASVVVEKKREKREGKWPVSS